MRSALLILAVIMMQLATQAFAQVENIKLLDYLVNPTEQERAMLKDLKITQIEEAIERYDESALIEQLHGLTNDIKSLQTKLSEVGTRKQNSVPKIDSIRSMIINQIQLLRLTGERKNIDRILKMAKQLIEEDPSDLTFMKPYLDVMFQIGDWDECERVLKLFEENCDDEYDNARITQNKASVANGRNQIPEAIELYKKALKTYEKYAEKEGMDYNDVATKMLVSDNLLTQLYFRVEEHDSALVYINKVLEIGDIAARYDSIDAPVAYASACNGIANKLMCYGDSVRADSVYAIAYNYIQNAYEKFPFRNGSTCAFYYMNHARDYMGRDNYEMAIVNSDKALEVMTLLYRAFPKWSAVNYFEALRLRAELYTLTNDTDNGFKMLKDAEAELEEIEADSPNSNQIRFYSLYYDFALNKATCEDLEGAIFYFEKAKDAVKNLDQRVRDRSVNLCNKYIQLISEELKKEKEKAY